MGAISGGGELIEVIFVVDAEADRLGSKMEGKAQTPSVASRW